MALSSIVLVGGQSVLCDYCLNYFRASDAPNVSSFFPEIYLCPDCEIILLKLFFNVDILAKCQLVYRNEGLLRINEATLIEILVESESSDLIRLMGRNFDGFTKRYKHSTEENIYRLRNGWCVVLFVANIPYFVGYFPTVVEAVTARKQAMHYFGHSCLLDKRHSGSAAHPEYPSDDVTTISNLSSSERRQSLTNNPQHEYNITSYNVTAPPVHVFPPPPPSPPITGYFGPSVSHPHIPTAVQHSPHYANAFSSHYLHPPSVIPALPIVPPLLSSAWTAPTPAIAAPTASANAFPNLPYHMHAYGHDPHFTTPHPQVLPSAPPVLPLPDVSEMTQEQKDDWMLQIYRSRKRTQPPGNRKRYKTIPKLLSAMSAGVDGDVYSGLQTGSSSQMTGVYYPPPPPLYHPPYPPAFTGGWSSHDPSTHAMLPAFASQPDIPMHQHLQSYVGGVHPQQTSHPLPPPPLIQHQHQHQHHEYQNDLQETYLRQMMFRQHHEQQQQHFYAQSQVHQVQQQQQQQQHQQQQQQLLRYHELHRHRLQTLRSQIESTSSSSPSPAPPSSVTSSSLSIDGNQENSSAQPDAYVGMEPVSPDSADDLSISKSNNTPALLLPLPPPLPPPLPLPLPLLQEQDQVELRGDYPVGVSSSTSSVIWHQMYSEEKETEVTTADKTIDENVDKEETLSCPIPLPLPLPFVVAEPDLYVPIHMSMSTRVQIYDHCEDYGVGGVGGGDGLSSTSTSLLSSAHDLQLIQMRRQRRLRGLYCPPVIDKDLVQAVLPALKSNNERCAEEDDEYVGMCLRRSDETESVASFPCLWEAVLTINPQTESDSAPAYRQWWTGKAMEIAIQSRKVVREAFLRHGSDLIRVSQELRWPMRDVVSYFYRVYLSTPVAKVLGMLQSQRLPVGSEHSRLVSDSAVIDISDLSGLLELEADTTLLDAL